MKVKDLRQALNMCKDEEMEVGVSVNIDEAAVDAEIVAWDIIEDEEGKHRLSLFINMYGLTFDEFERVTTGEGG